MGSYKVRKPMLYGFLVFTKVVGNSKQNFRLKIVGWRYLLQIIRLIVRKLSFKLFI